MADIQDSVQLKGWAAPGPRAVLIIKHPQKGATPFNTLCTTWKLLSGRIVVRWVGTWLNTWAGLRKELGVTTKEPSTSYYSVKTVRSDRPTCALPGLNSRKTQCYTYGFWDVSSTGITICLTTLHLLSAATEGDHWCSKISFQWDKITFSCLAVSSLITLEKHTARLSGMGAFGTVENTSSEVLLLGKLYARNLLLLKRLA